MSRAAVLLSFILAPNAAPATAEPAFEPPADGRGIYRNATLIDGDRARPGRTLAGPEHGGQLTICKWLRSMVQDQASAAIVVARRAEAP